MCGRVGKGEMRTKETAYTLYTHTHVIIIMFSLLHIGRDGGE